MENDFAEEELDATNPPPYRRRKTPNPDSKTKRLSSTGSDISRVEPDESSPLLSRTFDFEDSPTPNDDDRPPPTWYGERDHEGKPWYRTPSVRPYPIFGTFDCYPLTTLLRSIGSSPLS